MKILPNPSVPLADDGGLPTPALLGVLPGLGAGEPIVDQDGLPTVFFRRHLETLARPIPNASVQLLDGGLPTRAMTRLLMSLK